MGLEVRRRNSVYLVSCPYNFGLCWSRDLRSQENHSGSPKTSLGLELKVLGLLGPFSPGQMQECSARGHSIQKAVSTERMISVLARMLGPDKGKSGPCYRQEERFRRKEFLEGVP